MAALNQKGCQEKIKIKIEAEVRRDLEKEMLDRIKNIETKHHEELEKHALLHSQTVEKLKIFNTACEKEAQQAKSEVESLKKSLAACEVAGLESEARIKKLEDDVTLSLGLARDKEMLWKENESRVAELRKELAIISVKAEAGDLMKKDMAATKQDFESLGEALRGDQVLVELLGEAKMKAEEALEIAEEGRLEAEDGRRELEKAMEGERQTIQHLRAQVARLTLESKAAHEQVLERVRSVHEKAMDEEKSISEAHTSHLKAEYDSIFDDKARVLRESEERYEGIKEKYEQQLESMAVKEEELELIRARISARDVEMASFKDGLADDIAGIERMSAKGLEERDDRITELQEQIDSNLSLEESRSEEHEVELRLLKEAMLKEREENEAELLDAIRERDSRLERGLSELEETLGL